MNKFEYKKLLIDSSARGVFPSATSTGYCQYRGDNGRKCAVGLILPDEIFNVVDECGDANSLIETCEAGGLSLSWIPEGITPDDLQIIQGIHDDAVVKMRNNNCKIWPHDEFVGEIESLECFK